MSVGSLPIRRKCSWMRRISSTLSASPILSLSCASCGAEASPRTTSYRGNGADRRTNRSSIPVPPERTNGGATLCFSYGRERRAEWKLQVARCAHAGAMRRPFRASLASTPLVLEIVPPSRRASEKAVSNLVDRVRDAVGSSGRLDGLNLPQVLEENHQGQPFLRNMDPRDFVQRLGGDLGVDPIVNDVVAHMPSGPAFRRWVEESLDRFGLRSFVLVGGTNSRIRYPGPSVLEANRILRSVAEGHEDVALGNITIPDRENEVDRLVEKTQAGCDFFTTQVLFAAEPMATVLRAYGKRCAAQGLKPATVLLSFAPVSDFGSDALVPSLGRGFAVPTSGSARSEHRRGLSPQLRSRGADGARFPLLARGEISACRPCLNRMARFFARGRAPSSPARGGGIRTGKEDRDQWIVKCPKCGRIRESCRHVSRDDVRRIVRLLDAGVEVYQADDDHEAPEPHLHEPVRPVAQVVQPRYKMADIVLADQTKEGILDALAELRHKGLMYRRWGLKKVVKKTKGLSLLFAGPPGTGKTMAAEAISSELGRPMHVVNYAQLENMWVGETEKNIEQVFKAALDAGAVLFFDEADAVFQRRGVMATPWMNRDVNVLLSQMENYPGIVILATNLARVMDRALDRRIDIAVEFPLPDAPLRRKIYERLVPDEAPLAKGVDFDVLATKYLLSGGSILNVVRQAMRNSLRRGKRHRITMEDFTKAAEREMKKAALLSTDHLQEAPRRERLGGYA
ncbi:MAG: AAA family ATPase [Methanobacteriota archaeon]|nr:MAG: AAA family ATPase [Euryarchaeota archaeon]